MVRRGRVFIIEGPDGAGKTALARQLQQAWTHTLHASEPLEYLHQGPYRGDPLVDTVNLLERHKGPVICDRLHLGEQVYGPIYRGKDKLGVAGRRMLERYLLTRRAVVFLALPPWMVAHGNWAARRAEGGEMFPDEAGYAAVYDGFRQVRTALPLFWYDYTSVPLGEPLACLLRKRSRPWPDVLLVGERLAPNALRSGTPFAGRGGCAEWLAGQLDAAGIPEERLAWWNARTPSGRDAELPVWLNPDELDEGNRMPVVVALGKVAAAWCTAHVIRAGLKASVTVVPHPQAWRRFHYRERYPLLDLLSTQLHLSGWSRRNP